MQVRVQFFIRYSTQPGESLFVSGDNVALGLNSDEQLFALRYLDHEYWTGVIDLDSSAVARIHYSYVHRDINGELSHEGGHGRSADLSKAGIEEIQLIDAWNPSFAVENVFDTDPFRHTLLSHHAKIKPGSSKSFTHLFRVKAPLLGKQQALCLIGSAPATGEWDTGKPLLLSPEHGWWTVRVKLRKESIPLHYKYGVYDLRQKKFAGFETGENRILHGDGHDLKLTIIHDGFARLPNNTWRGAGVSIPVFSLRSKDSFGVGEFNDLKLLSDWAGKTGLKLIQVLPLNDTTATNTWKDSYPYASVSAFALHPIYLNLESIAGKHDLQIKALRKKQKQLNELPDLDYEQVMHFKVAALKDLFLERKEKFLQDEDFQQFFADSKHWLIPYAAFCYLRDRNGTPDFSRWKIYSVYNEAAIEKYVSPKARHFESIAFTYFLQYHLHLQLKEAVDYAHRNGVIIKGDVAIGVNRHSCDAWTHPELFHMQVQAGAPPDPFAVKGQNWGFPTYNWEQMATDRFCWWRQRFAQMGLYFDAFRIDHILGFFRIWNIPIESVEGIMGFFAPALPVHVYEFGQRGMWFNYHRFCKPHITDAVLWELFGPNKEKFFPYLTPTGNNQYILKDEFSTQRQVLTHFSTLEDSVDHARIKEGLYDLISNVILFERTGSNGQEFHFRISMEQTSSFRHLDWNMQQQLKGLYVDYFYSRQDELWRREAMKKLPSLKRATNMLVCGEDLGMVPRSVPQVMYKLGILSLEIQRMPKDPSRTFSSPGDAPYLSVVTPSTHDMSTIREWWEEDRHLTQQFFNTQLGQWGDAPQHCAGWISKAIVNQHLHSPAIWSIFQLQDLLGMDDEIRRTDPKGERINVPAISEHYWKYRMHLTLEQLLREKEFNGELAKYVETSGR